MVDRICLADPGVGCVAGIYVFIVEYYVEIGLKKLVGITCDVQVFAGRVVELDLFDVVTFKGVFEVLKHGWYDAQNQSIVYHIPVFVFLFDWEKLRDVHRNFERVDLLKLGQTPPE